jgi:hypothetical protein
MRRIAERLFLVFILFFLRAPPELCHDQIELSQSRVDA